MTHCDADDGADRSCDLLGLSARRLACGSTNRKTALTADARTALPRNNSSPLWLRNALECVNTVVAAINCSVHARYHKNLWMDVIVVWCE